MFEKADDEQFIHPYEQYAVSIMSPSESQWSSKFNALFGSEDTYDNNFANKYANTVVFSSKRFATEELGCKIIAVGSDDYDN